MKRYLVPLFAIVTFVFASSAHAQSLGTFRWQLQPYGSVLNLQITQAGAIYIMNGFEAQCGGNASLPVWGVAVPQTNGTVMIGLTTITELGSGLHTRATISISNFNGTWQDNANSNGTFTFNPGVTCPGGPRVGPIRPDAPEGIPNDSSAAALFEALRTELEAVRQKIADLEGRK